MSILAPEWLSSRIQTPYLNDECREYLYARGAKSDTLDALRVFTFEADGNPITGAENVFGKYGGHIEGWACFPVFSPTGVPIGLEARDIREKQILKHFLPRAQWNPVWVTKPDSLQRVFAGESAWIVEGVYDLFAMEWAISEPVFATLRASVTRNHVRYLQRYARGDVRIAYDNDMVGQKAVQGDKSKKGVVALLQQHGVRASAVHYLGGKDPGAIWTNGGATAVQQTFSLWR